MQCTELRKQGRVAYEDRAWDGRVLQEGVFPNEEGRPKQGRVIHEVGLLEDVVHGAHKGQLQAPAARRSAPVQRRPARSGSAVELGNDRPTVSAVTSAVPLQAVHTMASPAQPLPATCTCRAAPYSGSQCKA